MKPGIFVGMRTNTREWLDAYQPAYLKKYGWHFNQFYGRASLVSEYAAEVNTKYGLIPVNDEEMITYVGGGIWDVR